MAHCSPFSNFGSFQLLLLCSILFVACFGASNVFRTIPDYKVYMGGFTPTVVKISYLDSEIAVGFNNGTVSVYSNTGSYKYGMYGHNYSIIDIEEIRGLGWITLDTYGYACRWNYSGSFMFRWSFTQPAIDMSVTWQTYGYGYVGFNFGNMVLEYNASSNVNTTTRIYYPQTYSSFSRIQYTGTYSQLLASTNTSSLHVFNCSTGVYSTFISISSAVRDFATISTGQIVTVTNNYIYRVNCSYSYCTTSTYNLGQGSSPNIITAAYYQYDYIYVTGVANYSSSLLIYRNGNYLQALTNSNYYIRSVQASNTYLIVVDTGGYLSITSYYNGGDDIVINVFPVWAIVLISTSIFLICVVGIVVMVVRARKRRLALAGANGYARFDNPQPTQQFFPQPYSATNQGWNPNRVHINNQPQGWTQNQAPYVIPPAGQGSSQNNPINPYQANQPSNWS